jgi:glycosyltransferase involved in cell wall biosynthesis
MRILQVIDTLHIGGAEKVFIDVCTILSENEIEVTCLFLLETGALKDELNQNIPVIELHRTNKWSWAKMYQCSQILKQYDIIHCHFRHVYKYIALVSKVFNIKSAIVLHDHYGSIDIDKKVPFLLDSILKPDYYIGVSGSLQEWAEENLRIQKSRVFILENIIRKSIRKQHYEKSCDLILVSNIKPVKNNKFGLDIIKNLNVSLLLVGQNQNNGYYNEILDKKNSLNLNCELDASIKDVQPILHNFKLGLHTSMSESGPLAIIEYLAQGLPFLAYETGEVSKILKPYFPEFFIDNFEINQWAERIAMLLSKKSDTFKMQEVFEKHFGKELYFNKLISIYQCVKN